MKFLFKFIVLTTIININNLFSMFPSKFHFKYHHIDDIDDIDQYNNNENYSIDQIPFNYDNNENYEEIIFLKAVLDLSGEKNNLFSTPKESEELEKTATENISSYFNELKKSSNKNYLANNHNGLNFKIKELVDSISINLIEKSRFFAKKTPSNFFKQLFNRYKKNIKELFECTDENSCMEKILTKMKENSEIFYNSDFILDVIKCVTIKDSTKTKKENDLLSLYNKIFSLLNKLYNTKVKIKKKKIDVSLIWNKYKKPIIIGSSAAAAYGVSFLADKYGQGKLKNFGGSIYRNVNKAGRKTADFTKDKFNKGKEKLNKKIENYREAKWNSYENPTPSKFEKTKEFFKSKFKRNK